MEHCTSWESPLGWMMIEDDGQAIKSLAFTDEQPDILQSTDLGTQMIEQLEEYFSGKLDHFNIALNPQGSEFQKKVWAELIRLPYGTTMTYGELARKLGDANLSRAVGLANGKNPIAIVIPCHRVIGSDGSLTGYAGGLDRKKSLLQLEGMEFQMEMF